MRSLILLAIALPLAACDRHPDKSGTTVSITAENGSAGMVNGTASIDVPGFKGSITLPKITLDADNLELNGAKLYPGSTIRSVNIDAKDDHKDDGTVRVAFDAPASAAAVRDHFRKQLGDAGYQVADDGAGLAGTTDEGKPFKLTLATTANDRAQGELTIGH